MLQPETQDIDEIQLPTTHTVFNNFISKLLSKGQGLVPGLSPAQNLREHKGCSQFTTTFLARSSSKHCEDEQ